MSEIVVFHLREGANLESLATVSHSQAAQAFIELTQAIKAQRDFIRQFG